MCPSRSRVRPKYSIDTSSSSPAPDERLLIWCLTLLSCRSPLGPEGRSGLGTQPIPRQGRPTPRRRPPPPFVSVAYSKSLTPRREDKASGRSTISLTPIISNGPYIQVLFLLVGATHHGLLHRLPSRLFHGHCAHQGPAVSPPGLSV